jgi:hypothetical protein
MKSVNKLLPNIESYHRIKYIVPLSAAGLAFLEHPDLKDPNIMWNRGVSGNAAAVINTRV